MNSRLCTRFCIFFSLLLSSLSYFGEVDFDHRPVTGVQSSHQASFLLSRPLYPFSLSILERFAFVYENVIKSASDPGLMGSLHFVAFGGQKQTLQVVAKSLSLIALPKHVVEVSSICVQWLGRRRNSATLRHLTSLLSLYLTTPYPLSTK